MVLELVGQGVELPSIDAGKQAGRERPDAVAGRAGTISSRRQPASQRVVEHLLEWLSSAVHLIRDHPGHVGIEGHPGAHDGTMMLGLSDVKMFPLDGAPTFALPTRGRGGDRFADESVRGRRRRGLFTTP